MKHHNPFATLTRFEWGLWLTSLVAITASSLATGGEDLLSTAASLVGVTALIFVAKGAWLGQLLCIVFAAIYGIISFHFRYYGELITYVGMSLPMAAVSLVSWLRHPYEDSGEVEVSRLRRSQILVLIFGDLAVSVAFYFILGALGNANLAVSTVSVTTSFAAAYLVFCRSPYYALAYAANDLVLIVLWALAALTDVSCLPMLVCFVMFFANDLYGFFNWRRMQTKQAKLSQ